MKQPITSKYPHTTPRVRTRPQVERVTAQVSAATARFVERNGGSEWLTRMLEDLARRKGEQEW